MAALLAERILYADLPGLVAATLERLPAGPVTDLEAAFAADHEARRVATELLPANGSTHESRGHS